MTNGTRTPFFQEVLDALAQNSHEDLILLRDLCDAVDKGIELAAGDAARPLVKLKPTGRPLDIISSDLFYELMARVLKLGWGREFSRLMDWYEPLLRVAHTREEKLVDNWIGVLMHVPEPEPGLSAGELIRAWKAEINCLRRAFADLARIDVPVFVPEEFVPELEPRRGFGTANPLPTLEEQLSTAVHHVFRNTHMLFQQLLDRAVLQLERDRTTELLRVLRRLHEDRAKLLTEQKALDPPEKAVRTVLMRIRITEIQDGRPPRNPHLYLDAFRPYRSRRIPISSFDREEVGPLSDKPGLLGDSHIMRDKQLSYYFDAYGEPSDEKNTLTPALRRRQDLIKAKHGGQLKLRSNDDLVAFLTNLFEDTVRELMNLPAPQKQTFADASAIAWRTVLTFLGTYLERMTAHTSFDITEEPPNYLTIEFPRSLIGGVLHECGVYAVRMAYVLLSMARNVDRIFPRTFDMRASWIVLPLHVGLILESRTLALLVVHNQSLFLFPNEELVKREAEWVQNVPPGDRDPSDPDALRRKFIEDVAASAFNNDVDMPVLRFEVLSGSTPVTPKTIWYSYRGRVVPNYGKLFTKLVGVRRARQFQFDLRFLEVMRVQKKWFNAFVVPFWNVTCKKIWDDRKQGLVRNLEANRQDYVASLEAAIVALEKVYEDEVFPAKVELSSALRADRNLLPRGVRAVFAERQSLSARDVAAVTRVKEHIDSVNQPGFSFTDPVTKKTVDPPFARPEEVLVKIPE